MRYALALLMVFACRSTKTQEVDRASANGSATARVTLSDDEVVQRWFDSMEKQLAEDARQLATRQFATREDAENDLRSLTPAGFRPRSEYFRALFDEAGPPEVLARRLADYAATHGDVMGRRISAMSERLGPVMQQVFENVQRQFPSGSQAR